MPFDAAVSILGLSPAPFVILCGLIVLVMMLRWERHFEAATGHALLPAVFLKTRLVRHGSISRVGYFCLQFGYFYRGEFCADC